jgi:anti-sigma factor ChrR (cupin superfamily)
MNRPHPQLTDHLREELALYAFGLLEGESKVRMKDHLTAGCAVCNTEYRVLTALVAELPKALGRTAPAPELKQRLLARVRASSEQAEPGIFILRNSACAWKPTRVPGVSYAQLYSDPATKQSTTLLRLEPGSRYPAHHHRCLEQTWVIEGSCRIGEVRIARGDFAYALAGSDHGEVESEEGCVLLIIESQAA